MANVTICDRCGIILKTFTTGKVDVQVTRDVKSYCFTSRRTEYLHMCNNCYDAFGDFLRGDDRKNKIMVEEKDYEESEEAREEQ